MKSPQSGDKIFIPKYSTESEQALINVEWQQTLRPRKAAFYIVKAKNKSQGDSDVLLYVEDNYYKDTKNVHHVSKIPGSKEIDNGYEVPLNDYFQYGQRNKQGEDRWVVLHNKEDKMFQHRFMETTIQSKVAGWAETLAKAFGAGDIAKLVHDMGKGFIGDYLHTF